MKNKKKFTGLAATILTGTLLVGCSNPFDRMADGINSMLAEESTATDEPVGTAEVPVSDTGETAKESTQEAAEAETAEVETLDYSHLLGQGEATTLGEGTFMVGEDIPVGRYHVTATEGFGNIFVYDTEERLTFNEVMSGETDSIGQSEPGEAVIFLDDGHKVEISGMSGVSFTPYETAEVTELVPGQWVVGEDFPAGVYDISLEESESLGYLKVNAIKEYEKSRFALGNPAYGGATTFTTSFEEGEVVTVEVIPKVTLAER
ncbi:hypothetical protein FO441_08730 [Salinicoccus cyprini]|uniref:Lipoprotein n=1 Tax=Salinicoccus cyprini TaxID=2493691 RepID=A0A558AU25_9STAP|nr:hypothetical protein [Salinicoccus cyprini]TVT27782.1 hypothetical protein FO441_08730 [Salinicoccus cyprini]